MWSVEIERGGWEYHLEFGNKLFVEHNYKMTIAQYH